MDLLESVGPRPKQARYQAMPISICFKIRELVHLRRGSVVRSTIYEAPIKPNGLIGTKLNGTDVAFSVCYPGVPEDPSTLAQKPYCRSFRKFLNQRPRNSEI